MIDESTCDDLAVADALRARGVAGWSEDELAELVAFDDFPRHPVEGCRVDLERVARESGTSRKTGREIVPPEAPGGGHGPTGRQQRQEQGVR